MTDTRDHLGRPIVAVTGIGLVTPLGFGVAESWAGLLAGRSGISRITRFPTDHLRTAIAGQVVLPEEAGASPSPRPSGSSAWRRWPRRKRWRMPASAPHFPGPLFLGMPPVEIEWPQRLELARQTNGEETGRYPAMITAAAGRFRTCSRCSCSAASASGWPTVSAPGARRSR